MRSIRVWPRRLRAAAGRFLLPLSLLALAACSSNYNLGVSPNLGIAINVSLSVANGVTQLYPAEATTITATVSDDPTGAGVTWTLSGPGSLAQATPTTVVYDAVPATPTFPGAQSALITATSKVNPANNAAVSIVTFGTPVITPAAQFPANVGTPYGTNVNVVGGYSPYGWSLTSGSLPPGLTLSSSATSLATISGTPTAEGTYMFNLHVVDNQNNTSDQQFTIQVNANSTCLLPAGHYTVDFNGFRGGSEAVHLANIAIDSAGNITGEQDYKDGNRTTLDETLNTTSVCQSRTSNSGVLRLFAPSGELDYNFSATPPDGNGVIHSARIQIVGSATSSGVFTDSGSGELLLTDASAITGVAPSGNFAFGLLGVDNNVHHYGTIGQLTATGGSFAGTLDSNAGAAQATAPLGGDLTDAPASGTISAPDSFGRGTINLQGGVGSTSLVYYIVNANKLELMNAEQTVNTPREWGAMTSQTGDVNITSFDNAALASPSILSLYGKTGTIDPIAVNDLGRLSGANAGAGTVDLVLDSAIGSTDADDVVYSAQSYSIAANGRGSVTLTNASGTRNLVFYLDGSSSGYLLEQGSTSGNTGLLELQTPPPGGFTDTLPGEFVAGTQWTMASGPVTLQALMELAYGSLAGNYESGDFAMDNTGRGFGLVTLNGIATTADVLYIVSPDKMELMNFGTPTGTNASISWLIQ